MEDVTHNATHAAANFMLEAFASVGAAKFDLTLTTCQGEKESFRRAVPIERLRRTMPDILDRATNEQLNVIIRPVSPPVFLQLDDLDSAACERVQHVSFLILETSPQSFQSWIAVPSVEDEEFARRLKKGVGADPSASGATRVAGSFNFKAKYSPDFPRVAVVHANPGLMVSESDLAEFVASVPSTVPVRAGSAAPRTHSPVKKWPDYARCVAGAPLNNEGSSRDLSRADFTFCMIAIDWGWSIDEAAAKLMTESVKAIENGQRYARLTAERAAEAIVRRQAEGDRKS